MDQGTCLRKSIQKYIMSIENGQIKFSFLLNLFGHLNDHYLGSKKCSTISKNGQEIFQYLRLKYGTYGDTENLFTDQPNKNLQSRARRVGPEPTIAA